MGIVIKLDSTQYVMYELVAQCVYLYVSVYL